MSAELVCDNNSDHRVEDHYGTHDDWFKVQVGYKGPRLDFCSNRCASEWFARKDGEPRPVELGDGTINEVEAAS